jgi:hypothetical protein
MRVNIHTRVRVRVRPHTHTRMDIYIHTYIQIDVSLDRCLIVLELAMWSCRIPLHSHHHIYTHTIQINVCHLTGCLFCVGTCRMKQSLPFPSYTSPHTYIQTHLCITWLEGFFLYGIVLRSSHHVCMYVCIYVCFVRVCHTKQSPWNLTAYVRAYTRTHTHTHIHTKTCVSLDWRFFLCWNLLYEAIIIFFIIIIRDGTAADIRFAFLNARGQDCRVFQNACGHWFVRAYGCKYALCVCACVCVCVCVCMCTFNAMTIAKGYFISETEKYCHFLRKRSAISVSEKKNEPSPPFRFFLKYEVKHFVHLSGGLVYVCMHHAHVCIYVLSIYMYLFAHACLRLFWERVRFKIFL